MYKALCVSLLALLLPSPVTAYCYYDSYNYYYCTTGLSIGARIGISVAVILLTLALVSFCIMRKKRQARQRNAIFLQNQQKNPQPVPFQPQPPYAAPPYGGTPSHPEVAGGVPPYQPNTGSYMNNGPQPFQPGYGAGYGGGGGTPYLGGPTEKVGGIQEPPRTYNPDQPFSPPAGPPPGTSGGPPGYNGYVPPSGGPPPPPVNNPTNPYAIV
ncbi:hypothetical protein FRB91_001917 [Serendipita sp. 411]|nr:hypothetical protein FRC15_010932 [Serendipita sp. 397]KAG8820950.1 hypothetical protein FRC18_011546 [Serendipita sp. 400]KAG8824893.1 hypothetical protein FRC19_000887 [Serendipita sp. 401]KAG8845260.1 hypothetical protein FRB91_001917 [Serendipita sp. 411]KAG8863420.1 hypothetical protein FRC20_010759 [Serendipita sp. 405]KAG9055879.1 hypothetical protein FS842_000874 [Serendipita sp. 407]